MAKKTPKSERKIPFTYGVILPEGVDVAGYSEMNLSGRSQAFSPRDAVSNLIARRERELTEQGYPVQDHFIGRVMSQLDRYFGGADIYAFEHPQIPFPFVHQTPEDLRLGGRMSLPEKLLVREHAFAYELAKEDHADTSNPQVQLKYLGRARYLLSEANKIR
jgi:hypothetical protein